MDSLGKHLNHLYGTYDNIILLGDFNAETSEDDMKLFCTSYNLKNLVKKPTCFKNIDNPSWIDLVKKASCIDLVKKAICIDLVKKASCIDLVKKASCIDLILTNKPFSFRNTIVIETGLSDFHCLTITTIKCNFQKLKTSSNRL